METISIAIGDARSSTCIVLPREHELVRQLESLMPSATRSMPHVSSQVQQSQPCHLSSAMPQQCQVSSHTSTPVRSLSPLRRDQEIHRSAALIQSLLHRPTPPTNELDAPRPYRRGTTPHNTKRCHVPGCGKISVSRGVCRGHGGGRRCQFDGCSKSAQSRGDYCWSHGGGHRCEVPGCMRSRKSKRFCRNHLNWGSATSSVTREKTSHPAILLPRADAAHVPEVSLPPPPPTFGHHSPTRLPSLHQALQTHQTMLYGTGHRDESSSVGRPGFPTMLTSSISC